MEQAQLENILLKIAGKLRDKYGVEPDINHQGSIIVKNVSQPNAPIIPEEVEQIILGVISPLNLNPTEWPYTTNNGDIVIRYTP